MERSGYWLHKWTDETSSFDPHGRWSGGLDCYERDYSMWIPDRIKPDDTVAVNDYIDRQFELSAEVADGLEVIDAADAQATIAALQARVQELEEWQRIVTGTGTDQESVIRLAAHEYTKAAIQCWKEANEKLTADLTQRTAELEAANKLLYKKNCALGRTETIINDLQADLERVRGELVEATHNANVYQSLYSTGCMDRALLENDLRELRTLIAALPKVEGKIEVSSGVYNFILLKHDSGNRFLCGQIETEQTAKAIAALWQHRQGREG